MTTSAFWSTAGLEKTGALDGPALAAGAADAPGDPAGVGLCDLSEAFAAIVVDFLQPTRLRAKTRERIAIRVSINAVKRFKLEQQNYKRFFGCRRGISPPLRRVSAKKSCGERGR